VAFGWRSAGYFGWLFRLAISAGDFGWRFPPAVAAAVSWQLIFRTWPVSLAGTAA
jgi:hypothetical protein